MSGIVTKNADAKFWIPTENEWYKAAYYDPTKGGTGGYWLYPTQSNTIGGNTIGNANSANYYDGDYAGSGSSAFPTSNALTDVGAYGANSDSFYGTNDQGGNVWEWNDAVIGSTRGLRGNAWDNFEINLRSSFPTSVTPANHSLGSMEKKRSSGRFDLAISMSACCVFPSPKAMLLWPVITHTSPTTMLAISTFSLPVVTTMACGSALAPRAGKVTSQRPLSPMADFCTARLGDGFPVVGGI